MLRNIAKVEQFLSSVLEYEYTEYELEQLKNEIKDEKFVKPREIMDWINHEIVVAKEESNENAGHLYTTLDIVEKLNKEFDLGNLSSQHKEETLTLKFTVNSEAEEYKKRLTRLDEKLLNFKEQIFNFDDIAGTCLIIDSSGELLKYMNELIFVGSTNESDIRDRRFELRLRIRKVLDQKIN